MTDVDAALARLREAPVHPRLATIDEAVLNHMIARTSARDVSPAGFFGMAAVGALIMGIAGSSFPGEPVRLASSISPFGAPPMLAPSTLLESGE
ncbi:MULTISPECIES: hypothetical protein [unclassified Sphingobium]|uniref:hypothetical protein n=1 Tax=unclassified Sphingobium TaxID=2611147 RepID=UPI000445CEBC|nr:hypothetical protein [Sphingobium sp. Ant17]EXS70509.1 hypothetical protein BF95_18465 [Sphingobium sp. Ant17]